MTEDRLLTVRQVAERLQVHPKTVSAWLREGRLPGLRLGMRGPAAWRVRERDLIQFLNTAEWVADHEPPKREGS
jgi:excisionase family DNA binding protein